MKDEGRPAAEGVFLSYSRKDSARATDIADALREYGIYVWIDLNIPPGELWRGELDRRLSQCAALVVLMSPAARESTWVPREVAAAKRLRKPIFPLLIEGEPLSIVEEIQHESIVDGQPPSHLFARRVVEACRGERRTEPASAYPPPAPPVRCPGRGAALSRLIGDVLERNRGHVVDVRGLMGMGKSSLAALLFDATSRHFDAAHWLRVTEDGAGGFAEMCRSTLGFDPAEVADPARLLHEALSRQRLLVVVDDSAPDPLASRPRDGSLEAVLATAARNAPGRSLLVFTVARPARRPTHDLYEEVVIEGLPVPAAGRLLDDHGLHLGDESIGRLVTEYAGHAGAIVEAAREAVHQGQVIGFETELDVPPGVRSALELQMAHLTETQRDCLEYIAVARGTGTEEDLERVGRVSAPQRDVSRTRDELQERGWVRRDSLQSAPYLNTWIGEILGARIAAEIAAANPHTIRRLPLLTAFSDPATLRRQRRLLADVRLRLEDLLDVPVDDQLRELLEHEAHDDSGGLYGPGNLLNLLMSAGDTIEDLRVHDTVVRNADFRECEVRHSTFTDVGFEDSHFLESLEGVTSLVLSPSGAVVCAGTADGDVHLWDSKTGILVETLQGHTDVVTGLAFSEDGALLASSSDDGSVRIWNMETKRLMGRREGEGGALFCVAMDGRGDRIAAGGQDGRLHLWDVGSRKGPTIWVTAGDVRSVAVDAGGRYVVAGSTTGKLVAWDLATGDRRLDVEIPGGPIASLHFIGSTARILSSSQQAARTRLWNLSPPEELDEVPKIVRRASRLSLSPGNRIASRTLHDHAIQVVDYAQDEPVWTFESPELRMQHCAVNEEHGIVVAGGDSHAVSAWDLDSGRLRWTSKGHSRWIKSVEFSPDGRSIACCADDEAIHLWNLDSLRPLRTIRPHQGHIRRVVFRNSESGTPLLFTSSDDSTVGVTGISGELPEKLGPVTAGTWGLDVSPDGTLIAAGCRNGSVEVWSLGSRNHRSTLEAGTSYVRSVAFSPDAKLLATGGEDGRVRIWDLATEQPVLGFAHTKRVWCVRFSPRRTRLGGWIVASSGEEGTIALWSTRWRRPLCLLAGTGDSVWSLAFDPEGLQLVSGSSDRLMRAWPIPAPVRLGLPIKVKAAPAQEHAGHTNWVRSVAFSLDGTMLASGSHDGTVRLWRINDQYIVAEAGELPVLRPYEGLDLRQSKGLSEAQLDSLRALGAVVPERGQ